VTLLPIGGNQRNGLFAESAMDHSLNAQSNSGAFNGNPLPPQNAVALAIARSLITTLDED
jgi:hypothetical protein